MRSLYITGSARVAVLSVSVLLLLSTLPNTWLFANSESGNSQSTTHLEHWSDEELKSLQSLHIENLRPVPASPGNPLADDDRAAALGHRIFFDTRFSRTGTISCATCHHPDKNFSDGLAKGQAIGETERRTMSLLGSAFSPWFFWDGRSDSLWSQALGPLEKSNEHGGTRLQYLHLIASDENLHAAYEELFGKFPALDNQKRFPLSAGPFGNASEVAAWDSMSPQDKVLVNNTFANIGRVLEAYQRLLIPAPATLDHYLSALDKGDAVSASDAMTIDQVAGLRLFIGKGNCIDCHNGPLLSNNDFHNTGLYPQDSLPVDRGRIDAVQQLLASDFNCLSEIAGSDPADCGELRFVKTQGHELIAAFRTPSLRGMHDGPFMHTGEFATMAEVLDHYNIAPAGLLHNELEPLNFTEAELIQLELFLETVISAPAVAKEWLQAPPG